MKYTTLSGQVIEYADPPPALERFLYRAQALLNDRAAPEDELVALIYGRENPLLDQTLFTARGAVTPEVLAKPEYHILADFLARKRVQVEGKDPARMGAKYTLTVAEAAKRKGVTEDGIRKAIRARRLPAWIKDGEPYLEPKSLDAIELGTRGPVSKATEPLSFRVGFDKGSEASFRLRVAPGGDLPKVDPDESPVNQSKTVHDGEVKRWRKAAVLTGGHGKLRFFEIVPSSEASPEPLEFHKFFVRGKFMIIRKENNPKRAREAWEAFKAS